MELPEPVHGVRLTQPVGCLPDEVEGRAQRAAEG
ncbi:MAG: hypothetical protein JWQ95_501 [Sphaerisporangium sp.]|jgi:hypothetical protein|nr:hypothetical protein [Sphaerisporangium sp.]